MDFKKLTAPSLKELFVKEMEGMIISGKIEVGEKLPSERDLSEQMQVSRTIVHAGLAELEAKGFITVRPRVGIFVSDYRQNGSLATLVAIMSYNGGIMKSDEVRSIIEVRIALERLILTKVVPVITEEELTELGLILTDIENSKTAKEAADNCFRFQHSLTICSGNNLVPLFYGSFREPITNLWIRYCNLYGIADFAAHDRKLLDLIRTKDLEKVLDYSYRSLQASIDGDRQLYY